MGVSAAGLPESHQGSEVGPQHCPAEGRHGVDPHQAADEGVLAALEQGHDVGTHVVSVLLSEVLNEGETHPHSYSSGLSVILIIYRQFLYPRVYSNIKRERSQVTNTSRKNCLVVNGLTVGIQLFCAVFNYL